MIKEVTVSAPTVDEAIENAAKELGVDKSECSIEILETPKRTLFGKNKDAVIKATLLLEEGEGASNSADLRERKSETAAVGQQSVSSSAASDVAPAAAAVPVSFENANAKVKVAAQYLRSILDAMGLSNIAINLSEDAEGAIIAFDGEGMAVLIGHHGETLDALQYLVALTCNRTDGEYYRLTLDCGSYRLKREETLKGLATRIAAKVKKTGRSQLLEPMNPYERRIIHSIVSEIPGVFSKSKGEEPNRRVVVLLEGSGTAGSAGASGSTGAADGSRPVTFNKNTNRREDAFQRSATGGSATGGSADRRFATGRSGRPAPAKPYVHKPEKTMEEILKDDFKEKEKQGELYSKIEL